MPACMCLCVCQLWKSQWLQLHIASSLGPVRLEKYSNEEEARQSCDDVHKPIHLTNLQSLRRVAVDSRKQAIEITFSSAQNPPFVFCPDNGEWQINKDVMAWVVIRYLGLGISHSGLGIPRWTVPVCSDLFGSSTGVVS